MDDEVTRFTDEDAWTALKLGVQLLKEQDLSVETLMKEGYSEGEAREMSKWPNLSDDELMDLFLEELDVMREETHDEAKIIPFRKA